MRPDALLVAVARAEEAARSAYAFRAGSYAFDLVAAIASVRAAIDAPPDWIIAYLEYNHHVSDASRY
jgi:hypothetical protein